MHLSRLSFGFARQSSSVGSKVQAVCSEWRFASTTTKSFQFDDLTIEDCHPHQKQPKPDSSKLIFGNHFTDHMLDIPWSESQGWGKPHIGPMRTLQIHPAAKVLHYGIELFEGMKAYNCVDDKIRLFRPDMNMKRMNSSAKRLALPEFDGMELMRLMAQLIDVDRSWVPHAKNSSLYVRPTFIGTDPTLGVAKSREALLFVIMGPVGPYFPTGMKPVSLMADPQFVRSWPGGAGAYKMGSNYAPTIAVQKESEKQGCQQVLWLYGEQHYLTEVGTMNIFVHWTNAQNEKELITPPLDGLILPGVTRQSILDLARQWGDLKVIERPVTMAEVIEANQNKKLIEIFGAGTACVVNPVGRIHYRGQDVHLPVLDASQLISQRFYTELLDIQYGRTPNHPWAVDVDMLISGGEEKDAQPVKWKQAVKM